MKIEAIDLSPQSQQEAGIDPGLGHVEMARLGRMARVNHAFCRLSKVILVVGDFTTSMIVWCGAPANS